MDASATILGMTGAECETPDEPVIYVELIGGPVRVKPCDLDFARRIRLDYEARLANAMGVPRGGD